MNIFYGLPPQSIDTLILKKHNLRRNESGEIVPIINDNQIEDYNGNIIDKNTKSIVAALAEFDVITFC